jgi:hypothetical protein
VSLLIVTRLNNFRELWHVSLPSQVALPPAHTFIGWLKEYDDNEMQEAILRTGRKFTGKTKDGERVLPSDADRYCTATLKGNRERAQTAAWKQRAL